MFERQKRGELTDRIKTRSKELFGYEIDQTELRLLAYMHHIMVNEQKTEPSLISQADRGILQKWEEMGFMAGGGSGVMITKNFWDNMCEIVFLGYVDLCD